MVSEQSQALEAVKTAIRMEIDGKKFYQQASRASQNELGEKLFWQLAVEEDFHRRKFEDIYRKIQEQQSWPEVALKPHGKELETLFASASKEIKSSKTELEAIQTAMSMENKTLDFYQEQAAKAMFKAEKQFYLTLAGEESNHHAVLLDYYEYLRDPAQYFTMKEHHSLDGG